MFCIDVSLKIEDFEGWSSYMQVVLYLGKFGISFKLCT